MDHELKELLKELNEVLGDLLDEDKYSIGKKSKEVFEEALKQRATISIEKREDGTAETHIKGSSLAILITLAGLERGILKDLNVPSKVFDTIKILTGVKESKKYE